MNAHGAILWRRRRGRWLLLSALLVAVCCVAPPARAQCRVRVDTSLAFGTYDVFTKTPNDTTGQVSWRCPGNAGIQVQITLSRGSNGDATSRRLRSGAEFLRYDLYLDTARSRVWGDGTYGSSYTGTFPGGGAWLGVWVYGRMPAEQDVAVGVYTDNVLVVINF
jgi:spore coat protein U-like protein